MLRSVGVALTSACNLRCAYCYQRPAAVRRMDWETLRAALDLLVRSGSPAPQLTFLGGEPLLELPLIRRATAYLEQRLAPGVRPRYAITTNGTLLDEDALRFLASRRVQTHISFDGVEPAQRWRGEGTFAVLDALLDRLRVDFPGYLHDDVTFTVTLSSANVRSLAATVRYFLDRGVSSFTTWPLLTPDPGWNDDCVEELDRELGEASTACRRHLRRTGTVPFEVFRRDGRRRSRRRHDVRPCRIADGHAAVVDTDGELVACGLFAPSLVAPATELARCAADACRIGRIDDPELPERLEARCARLDGLRLFRAKEAKRSPYRACRDCRLLSECRICAWSIAAQPGNEDPDLVPALPCAFTILAAKHRRRVPSPRPPRL
jgi:sulfatase maturation enzyme AslB (radical SAM superfamily)